jgi:hypothetical protein
VKQTTAKWARPSVPELSEKKDGLIFQQLDIDYYTDKAMKGMPGAQSGTVATMRIFGVTRQQNSVCCHVHGFAPYFYVSVPTNFRVFSNNLQCLNCSLQHSNFCISLNNVGSFRKPLTRH